MHDTVHIICEGRHKRPVRVITFSRGFPNNDDPWQEVPWDAGAGAARHDESAHLDGMDRWLANATPGRFTATYLDGDDPGPLLALFGAGVDAVRWVYPIKCPNHRCRDGRTRRAEKLWPLLDLIIESAQVEEVLGRPHRSVELTIPDFWLIADEWDRRASAAQQDRAR